MCVEYPKVRSSAVNHQEIDAESEELFSLLEKAVEGELSEQDSAMLDRLVTRDRKARLLCIEYFDQHACLHWNGVSISENDHRNFVHALIDATADQTISERPRILEASRWTTWFSAVAICTAILTVGFYGGTRNNVRQTPASKTVATLVKTRACTWGSGSLPTEVGSFLTRGRMRLVSGLATVRFESGAEVAIEAPAEIEMVDAMHCILHEGVLVARVPLQVREFVVETANARVADQGIEFGVYFDRSNGGTNIDAFKGTVEVEQRSTQERLSLPEGQSVSVGEKHIAFDRHDENAESGPEMFTSVTAKSDKNTIAITTSDGGGRECVVESLKKTNRVAKTLLLVKNAEGKSRHLRKIYMAFDLRSLGSDLAKDAELRLHVQRAGFGYASSVPDSTFAVYGLINEERDDWNAQTLTWSNAPANLPGGAAIDLSQAELLGRFMIPQGKYSGFAGIQDERLVNFINKDTNGMVTFVIVRETLPIHKGGIVHAFSGNAHPGGIAPTLYVTKE